MVLQAIYQKAEQLGFPQASGSRSQSIGVRSRSKSRENMVSDINPKLSNDDTPVSGVKIFKPYSRSRSRGRPLDFDSSITGGLISQSELQSKPKSRQEVRFKSEASEIVDKNDEKIPSSYRKSQVGQSSSRADKSRPHSEEKRQETPNQKEASNRSSMRKTRIHMSRSTDLLRVADWVDRNVSRQRSPPYKVASVKSQEDGSIAKASQSRELIRNESIKRIQKVNLSTLKSQSSSATRPLHEPTKAELSEKFSCLRDRKKRDHSKNSGRVKIEGVFLDDNYKEKYITDLKVDPVPLKRVEALHNWVQALGYLKYYNINNELPDECRNGSFFFKLINHLERHPVLKGENTSNRTAIKVNFEKMFSHLRKFEKYNPRYLSAQYYLINGHKDVFWGLVEDIRATYNNKISKADKRFKKANNINDEREEDEVSDFNYSLSPPGSRSTSRRTAREQIQHPKVGLQQVSIQTISKPGYSARHHAALSSRQKLPVTKALPSERLRLPQDEFSTEADSKNIAVLRSCGRYVDFENSSKPQPKKLRIDFNNLADLEADCRHWFQDLKLRVANKENLFEDSLRNGYMLCYLCSVVFGRKIKHVCKDPRSVADCRNNVEAALHLLRSTNAAIPRELLWQADEVLKGNPAIIWPLFACLKFIHETKSTDAANANVVRGAQVSSVNLKTLPYTQVQIAQLEQSLLRWLIALGVFNRDSRLPDCFEDIVDAVRQGAVLAGIITKITGKVFRGLHMKPISNANYTHNVRKCVEHLLSVPHMSRKFLWKPEAIVDGDRLIIAGLLEDLNRLQAGLPQRKDPDYFADGPLLIYYPEPPTCSKQHLDDVNKKQADDKTANDDLDTATLVKAISSKPHANRIKNYFDPSKKLNDAQEIQRQSTSNVLQKVEETFGAKHNKVDEDPQVPIASVKRVVKMLLDLNMPQVVERETWNYPVWTLFSDG